MLKTFAWLNKIAKKNAKNIMQLLSDNVNQKKNLEEFSFKSSTLIKGVQELIIICNYALVLR